MTKQQTIEILQQQLPGFYSVEQVINVINGIEDFKPITLTEDQINELASQVAEEIADEGLNLIDDYDLSMSYKEVELDGVDYNDRAMVNAAKRAIGGYLETLLETTQEEVNNEN